MKLKDIIEEYISGDWGNDAPTDDTPCAIYCVRGADIVPISNASFDAIPKRYISEKSEKSRILSCGDIVIEKSGGSPTQSTGRVVYISDKLIENKHNVVCSNFCCAVRIKKNWNPKSVYYYWQYVYNLGVFFNFEGKTSGLKNLQLENALAAIDIPELPRDKQDAIVQTLSTYEDKIALNREINRNLEAIARQLYDYWFVQFDFPDSDGKPYKSSGGKMVWNEKLKREIPDGWEVVNLFDGVEVQYGFPFSTELFVEDETAIPVVRIRDILNGTTSAFSTEIADSKYKLAKGDLLIGMDGNFHMNLWSDDKAYLNQRSVRIRRKEDNQISALQVLFEIAPYIKAKEQNAKGSTVGHLSDKDLKGIWLLSPSSNTHFVPALTFGNIAANLISNRNEIAALTAQRDELLPLLMNGQVSVRPTAVNCDLSHD